MLRRIVCGFVVLALAAGAGAAAQKGKKAQQPHPIMGTIKKVDAAAGTLTVEHKIKKATATRDFTVDDSTKVIIFKGGDRKVLTGKDALKDDAFKEGARVAVVADDDGKVSELRGGDLPKGKKGNVVRGHIKKKGNVVRGHIKKIDAAAGTLTVAVKNKKETTDRDFQITDATKIIVFNGDDKKEATGKDGLKNDLIKEGVVAAVNTNAAGEVTEVRVGKPPKKNK